MVARTAGAPTEPTARPTTRRRSALLPAGWPIYALFLGFPLWWTAGLGAFIAPIMALPMAAWLFRRRQLLAPRGFAIWLAFLVWMFASVIRLDDTDKYIRFTYTASLYLSATVILLYVLNISREALPTGRIVTIMSVFWMFVVAWGVFGVIAPRAEFTSPTERVMPQRFASNEFVHDLVHPALSQVQDILGYDQPRPKAPFAYATNWGAAFGLLTPFVVLSWKLSRSRRWRILTGSVFVLSIVPLVSSLDRGLWLSLGTGLFYAAIRAAMAGQGRALRATLVMIALIVGVIYLTPLRTLVSDRFAHPHSNERRLSLYTESTQRVMESPFLGYGAPVPSLVNPDAPPVGTQGQLWQVLVSHGIPGALFFVWWFLYQFWRTRAGRSDVQLWCHTIILIGLIQMPFYDSLGIPLVILMIAIAVATRGSLSDPTTPPVREAHEAVGGDQARADG